MAAFRLAWETGADGIEFDVRLTRDGIPVVIHDDNLKRTAGVPHRILDLDLVELKQFDFGVWFGNTFSGERIPTLAELFQYFASTRARLYLEMKSTGSEYEPLARTCCDFISRSSLKDNVVVECFDLNAIRLVKKIDDQIKTAALFEPRLMSLSSFAGKRLVDAAIEVGANEIALHHRLATEATITSAKRAGLGIVVWTVEDPRWLNLGVDVLITNDPGALVSRRDCTGHNDLKL